VLAAGQEIGTVRNLARILVAVPALSPYIVRVDPTKTEVRVEGPGRRTFAATFLESITEPSPLLGESRLLIYQFSEADSPVLAGMIQSNVDARVVWVPGHPVAVVAKLPASLAHPDAFRGGWAAGVAKLWPGWTLECEGENDLGCVASPGDR
jgi:hypothetical protein